MSSRITKVKDFYDLYISDKRHHVFKKMYYRGWFKCYFWDDESIRQFEILDPIVGNRSWNWNSFVVMPEVAGVKMSDILTELIDNHIDVDELCQTAMDTYIESLEQVLPDGHVKDLFIKVYEFSGSGTDLSFREFCKKNQTELNCLTQEFKVSRTHDTGDKLFKFCMSSLEDGEICNLGLTVFFNMSSRKILGDAYVDQVNHAIE